MKEVYGHWRAAGRSGSPRVVAHCYVALGGEDVVDDARTTLVDYYDYTGEAGGIAEYMVTTPRDLRIAIDRYSDLGVDEVMCYCWARDAGQVERIADVL